MDVIGPFTMVTVSLVGLSLIMGGSSLDGDSRSGVRSNGQTEVTNREILKGLRARLDHARGSWVDELPSVLWPHHTTPREVINITPFHLVYNGEVVVPVEVEVESDRVQFYDDGNAKRRIMELNLVDKVKDKTSIRLMMYTQCMKQNYNQMVIPRLFQVSDLVWKRVKSVGNVTKLEAQ
ncbi:uncharacterized protein LOC122029221 [Zingiber officinale]|uniref:uncharacterized protein LOC122029221 n=1 Tax=Zingiber officinale TaxID=94328 RepID=UPI001C4C128C|nr:uncharacterized protein LOC122029221 [Zingiber officinale]